MMLIVVAAFTFVILNKPAGFTPGITTSIPPASQELISTPSSQTAAVNQPSGPSTNSNSSSINIGTAVLIGFLIILALLFMWYLGIKIAKELRNH